MPLPDLAVNKEGNTPEDNNLSPSPKTTYSGTAGGQDISRPQPEPGGLGGTGQYHLIQQQGEDVPLRILVPMNTNNNFAAQQKRRGPDDGWWLRTTTTDAEQRAIKNN